MFEEFSVYSLARSYKVQFYNKVKHISNSLPDATWIVDPKILDLYDIDIHDNYVIEVDSCESNKTLDSCSRILDQLIESKFRKDDHIIALGGGIIQDISTFVSSILYRGIEWYYIPTTLLGQADSCIGGKSSINHGKYKNLIGNFYPPDRIYICPEFLTSLPEDDLKSGIGEMLHFFMVKGDISVASNMMNNYESLIHHESDFLPYIKRSLKIKKEVIEVDEYDKGIRNLFNYGHTFGHALESMTEYQINHGQAVTLGMDLSNFISFKKGMLSQESFNIMHSVIEKNIPNISDFSMDKYVDALSRDKKNKGSQLGCILTRGPGSMVKCHIDMDSSFKEWIEEYFDEAEKTNN